MPPDGFSVRRYLRADVRAVYPDATVRDTLRFALTPGFLALVFLRLGQLGTHRSLPLLGHLSRWFAHLLTGADFVPGCEVGPGLRIDHPNGVVIGQGARVGAGVTLLHGVTLGSKSLEHADGYPTIADGVTIAVGAVVLGAVTVGAGAFIGVRAVVTTDVAAGTRVLGDTADR